MSNGGKKGKDDKKSQGQTKDTKASAGGKSGKSSGKGK